VTAVIEGEPASAALAAALDRLAELVPYLSARIDPPDLWSPPDGHDAGHRLPADGRFLAGQTLIDEPALLGRIIRATGAEIGTEDPVVAASAFVQGYSYRLVTLTVGCLTAAGVAPDASAGRMATGLSRGWPSLVAFLRPAVMVLDGADISEFPADSATITDALGFVVDATIDNHLRPLIDAVRAGIGVALGERLLWGNVAASAATAFRTMAGCLGPWAEPLGERFFALSPPELQGLGSFLVLVHDGRRGWFWERTNCCLFDRLPGAVRCADCSLTAPELRRRAYRAALGASGT